MVHELRASDEGTPLDLGVQFLRVGLGSDTSFRLDVTEAQWKKFDLRRQLAHYAQFLAGALQEARLQPADRAGGSEFTFSLGEGATLKCPRAERLDVRVDGQPVCGFDRAPLKSSVDYGRSRLHPVNPAADACGVAVFDDVERVDAHAAKVVPDGRSRLGGGAQALIEPAARDSGITQGVLFWSYTLPEAAKGRLREGEPLEASFWLTDPTRVALGFRLIVSASLVAGEPVVSGRIEEEVEHEEGCVRYSLSGRLDTAVEGGALPAALRVRPGRGNPLGGQLTMSVRASDAQPSVWWCYTLSGRVLLRLARDRTHEEQFIVCLGTDRTGKPVHRQITIAVTGRAGPPLIRLVSMDEPEVSLAAECRLLPHAAALVSLTRTLWLSQPGQMLVSARPPSAEPMPDRMAHLPLAARDFLGIERYRPLA